LKIDDGATYISVRQSLFWTEYSSSEQYFALPFTKASWTIHSSMSVYFSL